MHAHFDQFLGGQRARFGQNVGPGTAPVSDVVQQRRRMDAFDLVRRHSERLGQEPSRTLVLAAPIAWKRCRASIASARASTSPGGGVPAASSNLARWCADHAQMLPLCPVRDRERRDGNQEQRESNGRSRPRERHEPRRGKDGHDADQHDDPGSIPRDDTSVMAVNPRRAGAIRTQTCPYSSAMNAPNAGTARPTCL